MVRAEHQIYYLVLGLITLVIPISTYIYVTPKIKCSFPPLLIKATAWGINILKVVAAWGLKIFLILGVLFSILLLIGYFVYHEISNLIGAIIVLAVSVSAYIFLIPRLKRPSFDFEEVKSRSAEEYYHEPTEEYYHEPTLEDVVIGLVRHFEPSWRYKDGKLKLEGGENGNNANLAQYLRTKGINAETDETLANGSRPDLIINDDIVIECKTHLKSVEKLHSLSGEVKRVRRMARYKVYALIYGEARRDLYRELSNEIGQSKIIHLGELTNSKVDEEDL